MCYIRMIVFVSIVQIVMSYNVISSSRRFPDVSDLITLNDLNYIRDLITLVT